MFLLRTIFMYFERFNFFYKKDNAKCYEDNFNNFSEFFFYINHNKDYFEKFFKKFNINVDNAFMYLYFLYFLARKYKLIKAGEFETFFLMVCYLNKIKKVLNYKVLTFLEYISIFDFSKIYQNQSYEKYLKERLKWFNIKFSIKKLDKKFIEMIKNFYKKSSNKSLNVIDNNIRFDSSSIVKHINDDTNYSMYFLRKNKSFNKGRYSRNRQNYRTGVYWCLYINVLALFALYYFFYRFTFNFGYLWWLFYCLPASFIIPQVVKHRLYSPSVFLNYLVSYFEFLFNCVNIIFFKK